MLELTRRGVVRGALVGLAGLVAGYLAARDSSAADAARGTGAANAYGPAARSGGRMLVSLDQVPTGGGVVLEDARIVVTRSATDDVRAFTAVCTHQGCTVATVVDVIIQCPCHGSQYDAGTGQVRRGPATRPLAPVAVVVRSGKVFAS